MKKSIFRAILTSSLFLASIFPAYSIEKPKEVRGIYITADTASRKVSFDSLVREVDKNPLNTIVIDVKESNGVLYKKYNLDEIVKELHKKNIYVIARQVVFKDYSFTKANPNLSLGSREGRFANPTSKEVREYNINIALDVIKSGVDEIQFDYIRFPDDYHGLSSSKKVEAVNLFLKEAKEAIKKENPKVKISADIFGYATWNNNLGIGQSLEDIAKSVDVICPMAYPSHYSAGHRKLGEYEVIKLTVEKANERLKKVGLEKNVEIRPWIQGFNMKSNFNQQYMINQIKATRDTGCDGFLIWNAQNIYSIPFSASEKLDSN